MANIALTEKNKWAILLIADYILCDSPRDDMLPRDYARVGEALRNIPSFMESRAQGQLIFSVRGYQQTPIRKNFKIPKSKSGVYSFARTSGILKFSQDTLGSRITVPLQLTEGAHVYVPKFAREVKDRLLGCEQFSMIDRALLQSIPWKRAAEEKEWILDAKFVEERTCLGEM